MGYCMEQRSCNFKIKKEHFEDALKAMKALVAQDDKKSGGSFKEGKTVEKFFAWTDNDEILNAETIVAAFVAWRWEVDVRDGDIDNIFFVGEKLGDDMHLFRAIAPFVEVGSYIEMTGEDGGHWRWRFDGKTCEEVGAELNWAKDNFNCCPECGATDPDIEWGDKEWHDRCASQDAECKKCGCEFQEIYNYACTEVKESGNTVKK